VSYRRAGIQCCELTRCTRSGDARIDEGLHAVPARRCLVDGQPAQQPGLRPRARWRRRQGLRAQHPFHQQTQPQVGRGGRGRRRPLPAASAVGWPPLDAARPLWPHRLAREQHFGRLFVPRQRLPATLRQRGRTLRRGQDHPLLANR